MVGVLRALRRQAVFHLITGLYRAERFDYGAEARRALDDESTVLPKRDASLYTPALIRGSVVTSAHGLLPIATDASGAHGTHGMSSSFVVVVVVIVVAVVVVSSSSWSSWSSSLSSSSAVSFLPSISSSLAAAAADAAAALAAAVAAAAPQPPPPRTADTNGVHQPVGIKVGVFSGRRRCAPPHTRHMSMPS
jgi:hypothetical protein